MNSLFDGEVEIVTPCFCAGADQNIAEIRAPSVRGEWRWWFRALGGSRADEAAIFGSAAGKHGTASKVVVRVAMISKAPEKNIRLGGISDPLTYLLFFVDRASHGARLKVEGFVSPKSKFRLQVMAKPSLGKELSSMAERSLFVMLRFGAIGYRARRGCGSLSVEEIGFDEFVEQAREIGGAGVEVVWLERDNQPLLFQSWRDVMREFGTVLKALRKDGYSAGRYGDTMTPFGNAGNRRHHLDRQASGVRLRAVKLKDGILPAIVFSEAGLDRKCRDNSFYLKGKRVGSGTLVGF